MEYLWTKGLTPPGFPTLETDMDTDILIIGGGMAGILCAMKLQEAGANYVLVEGERIGKGITKGTTAVLTAQHDILYQDILRKFGNEKAAQYLYANLHAVKQYRRLSRDIPCDFEEKPSLMFSRNDKTLMEQETEALHQLGFDAVFTTETPLPFSVAGAVRFDGMAQFHPLKFLYGAAKDLHIYEQTYVEKLKGTTAYTSQGVIHARKVIIATHFPFINSHGLYFAKLYQQRSYVIALENAPDLGCTIEDVDKGGIYLRNHGNLLLAGAGDHRTGQKNDGYAAVRDFCRQNFPDAREKFSWSNQDCITLDGIPYIGPYSTHYPDVYVASGFHLWGMTTSMIAAEILTDMVLGCTNRFAPVFSPQRNMLTGQLFVNAGISALHFLTPTTKRCTHMGCALHWNPIEQSWDCPCHGSRFDRHGNLIDNPARRDSHVE